MPGAVHCVCLSLHYYNELFFNGNLLINFNTIIANFEKKTNPDIAIHSVQHSDILYSICMDIFMLYFLGGKSRTKSNIFL